MFFEQEKIRKIESSSFRQILITINPILCRAIKRSYQNMTRQCFVHNQSEGNNLLVLEEDEERLDVSILGAQESFPLILTYKSFLLLLNDCLPLSFFTYYRISGQEVSFERYINRYYAHCAEGTRSQFDANFIFTEIITSIKGSLNSLQSPRGMLSRSEYLNLANTRNSFLSCQQRDMIYSEFEKYESLKSNSFEYDILDLVHYVYRNMSASNVKFPSIHSIFVDEVQDLTPAQIALFKFICLNRDGFVFAGDTAQTIAPGVGFRFESVKDVFFHEIFPDNGNDRVPQFYHLKQNFRTHDGIVNLANSIVELLVHFFPQGIDKLDPEFSLIEGPLPIILSSNNDVIRSIFSVSGENKPLECGFGAEQVILVRDERMKDKVKDIVKGKSLVLTALESKGMEFTDCLIYNFFSSTTIGNDWRTLYQYIDPQQRHATFDSRLHSAICCELKLLYVLITRARRNLVIYDDQSPQMIPIFYMWIQRNLINIREYDENIRNIFVKFSSSEEWNARGKVFLEQRQFSHARMCFHNSGDLYLEKFCEACELEQKADKISVSEPRESCNLYRAAAELYLLVPNQEFRTARCFELCKEFGKAATLYLQCEKYSLAASCYEAGKDYIQASEAYVKASQYNKALQCCKKISFFEKAIEIIDSLAGAIDQSEHGKMKNEWLYNAAINYNSKGNKGKASEFVNMLSSPVDQRKFYERYCYMDELRELNFKEEKFEETALLYERRLNFLDAANCYEKGRFSSETCRCLLKVIRPKFLNSNFLYLGEPSEIVGCDEVMGRLEQLIVENRSLCSSCPYFMEARFLVHCKNRDQDFEALDSHSIAWTPFQLRLDLFKYSSVTSPKLLDQYLLSFRNDISKLLLICQKLDAGNSLKVFAKTDLDLCLKLFEYFELIPDHSNYMHAKYLIGLKNNLQEFQLHFPRVQDAPSINLCAFKVDFLNFARSAKAYFIRLYFDFCDRVAIPLLSEFDDINSDLSRRYGISVLLNSIYGKHDLFDEDLLPKKRQQQRHSIRQRLNAFYLNLLLATPFTNQNWELIITARNDDRLLDLVTEKAEKLSIDCHHRDDLVRALLYSDFLNTQRQTAERLRNADKKIFIDSRARDLLLAYQWQNEKVREGGDSTLPLDWVHGEFLYSIDIGRRAVLSELWRYSINQAAWGGVKTNCMSPNSFLELIEKYFVWLQLHSKRFYNVIFPTNFVRSIICLKTVGYANAVKLNQSHQLLSDTIHFCNISTHSILEALIGTCSEINLRIFHNWMNASKSPNVSDIQECLYSFTTRMVHILFISVLNMKHNQHRDRLFQKIRTNFSLNLNNFQPGLRKAFNNFEVGLEKFPKTCVSYFRNLDDPLSCFDLRFNSIENPRSLWNLGIRSRQIIIVDSENSIQIVPPQPSPSLDNSQDVEVVEDFPDEDMNIHSFIHSENDAVEPPAAQQLKPLGHILQKYRNYLRFRNQPIGLLWKAQEKILQEHGINIDSPQVHYYLESICPFVEILRKFREECDVKVQILSVSTVPPLSPFSHIL